MQALESLLREEFRSDPYVGTGAEEVLAVVGAAHRRSQRRSAVAGAVVVLLATAGALSAARHRAVAVHAGPTARSSPVSTRPTRTPSSTTWRRRALNPKTARG